jgi:RNAse (barnase) inhibitor barstar
MNFSLDLANINNSKQFHQLAIETFDFADNYGRTWDDFEDSVDDTILDLIKKGEDQITITTMNFVPKCSFKKTLLTILGALESEYDQVELVVIHQIGRVLK